MTGDAHDKLAEMTQDVDIRRFFRDEVDYLTCVEQRHQGTFWDDGYSTWYVRLSLDGIESLDVGWITMELNKYDYVATEKPRRTADSSVGVHSDGTVTVLIRVGPNAGRD